MNLINYVYDNEVSLRVKSEYKVFEKLEVFDYMHGRCHLFALVASEILQAPLQAYVVPHEHFGFCLSHVFCKVNKNTILDASGLWNLHSMKDRYKEPGMYLHSDGFRLKQELWEMMKAQELPYFVKGEEESILNYLENMKKIGCLQLLINENEPMVDIQIILNSKEKDVRIKR